MTTACGFSGSLPTLQRELIECASSTDGAKRTSQPLPQPQKYLAQLPSRGDEFSPPHTSHRGTCPTQHTQAVWRGEETICRQKLSSPPAKHSSKASLFHPAPVQAPFSLCTVCLASQLSAVLACPPRRAAEWAPVSHSVRWRGRLPGPLSASPARAKRGAAP